MLSALGISHSAVSLNTSLSSIASATLFFCTFKCSCSISIDSLPTTLSSIFSSHSPLTSEGNLLFSLLFLLKLTMPQLSLLLKTDYWSDFIFYFFLIVPMLNQKHWSVHPNSKTSHASLLTISSLLNLSYFNPRRLNSYFNPERLKELSDFITTTFHAPMTSNATYWQVRSLEVSWIVLLQAAVWLLVIHSVPM